MIRFTVTRKVIHQENPKEECNVDDALTVEHLSLRLLLVRGYGPGSLCLHCFPLLEEGEPE